jgi:hypothetical protein
MTQPFLSSDFEPRSWHDHPFTGLRLEVGDPDRGDWQADLVLEIDHILEWLAGTDGRFHFRVAAARLTFHDVTDLRLAIDSATAAGQVALHELSVDTIMRVRIRDQKICLDRPYWRWRPLGGAISFGASGFTQSVRPTPAKPWHRSRHARSACADCRGPERIGGSSSSTRFIAVRPASSGRCSPTASTGGGRAPRPHGCCAG